MVIALDRPPQHAVADAQLAVVPGELPASSAAMQASNGMAAIRRNDSKSASCPVMVGLPCGSRSSENDRLLSASLAVRQPSVMWLTHPLSAC